MKDLESGYVFLIANAIIDEETGCWNCHFEPNAKGYCYISIGGRSGRSLRAHRVIYAVGKGEIPDNMQVLHTCDNRRCINPEHLFLGTDHDNMKDMIAKGRKWIGVTRFRLPEQDINLLREFKDRGFNYAQIARCLHVSHSTVFNYLSPTGPYYVPPSA